MSPKVLGMPWDRQTKAHQPALFRAAAAWTEVESTRTDCHRSGPVSHRSSVSAPLLPLKWPGRPARRGCCGRCLQVAAEGWGLSVKVLAGRRWGGFTIGCVHRTRLRMACQGIDWLAVGTQRGRHPPGGIITPAGALVLGAVRRTLMVFC